MTELQGLKSSWFGFSGRLVVFGFFVGGGGGGGGVLFCFVFVFE